MLCRLHKLTRFRQNVVAVLRESMLAALLYCFFSLSCCSCGEMRLPHRMSVKVGAVCSGCELNVSRETFGVAGCERIPMQGIRLLPALIDAAHRARE